MSVDTTNTPNGASNNLYEKNVDKGEVEINFLALEERDPQRGEAESDDAGNNSVVAPVEIGTFDTDMINKVGYVGIVMTNVPVKEDYDKKKAEIKAKAEKSKAEHDKDKDNDGIDDRNQ